MRHDPHDWNFPPEMVPYSCDLCGIEVIRGERKPGEFRWTFSPGWNGWTSTAGFDWCPEHEPPAPDHEADDDQEGDELPF